MKRVVIIGAGPAGLTAAYELIKNNNYEVIVIEKDNQVGGISKTINYKGNRMDLGGHRFFSKDQRVLEFWHSFLPFQNDFKQENIMLKRKRISHIYYLKKFFDYPVNLNLSTIKNLGLIRIIKGGISYLKSCFFKREETNLENFYINRFGKNLYKTFFENYTEKVWGRHPSEISSEWGSQRVKGISIIAVIKDYFFKIFHIKNSNKEISLIEEYLYPKYGPGQLWELVSNKFEKMGGKLLKNTEVIKIIKDNNEIKSIIVKNCQKEQEIKGDIFISTMPVKDLITNMNDPKNNIKNIASNLPYRDFITIGLLVKKLKLHSKSKIKTKNDIISDCWIYIQEPKVKLGRIQIFNNWSPYMTKNPDTIWIGLEYFCSEGDDFWRKKNKDIVNFAIDELIKLNIIDRKDLIDSHLERVKKAYPAYFDSYKQFDQVKEYLNSIDNLYCIGRNGQHRYNNMDHSMMTAFLAVDNIINNKKEKENIWNVNTEKKYHE